MQIRRKRVNGGKQRRKLRELGRRRKGQSHHSDISRRRRSTGRLRNERINRRTRRKKKHTRK